VGTQNRSRAWELQKKKQKEKLFFGITGHNHVPGLPEKANLMTTSPHTAVRFSKHKQSHSHAPQRGKKKLKFPFFKNKRRKKFFFFSLTAISIDAGHPAVCGDHDVCAFQVNTPEPNGRAGPQPVPKIG
jgi:hypothetical protein